MPQSTEEVASPPVITSTTSFSSRRKNPEASLYRCTTHGYLSDPNASPESQKHGLEVHKRRAHRKKTTKEKKNKVIAGSSNSPKNGVLQVITDEGVKTIRAKTKPPKAFFDLKENWVKEAANCSGAEQDAFLACATDLGRLLKTFK